MKVLFRKSIAEEGEFDTCRKYCNTVESRLDCNDETVVARYSCLPYYNELTKDLTARNCTLINSLNQHNWIAKFEWYDAIKEYTPQTWFSEREVRLSGYEGPFVIKGKTNSRKHQWRTHMYAANIDELYRVANELHNDGLIGYQDLIYRKFEPLETFEYGLNGLPFTNEWRFFLYKQEIIAYGYYWATAEKTDWPSDIESILLVKKLAAICSNYTNFYVLDVAKTQEGKWILIEVNDGQMSGLSCIDGDLFYKNLNEIIK